MIKVNGHTAGIKVVVDGKGNATKVEGTFTSASTQYGIVDVNVGFKPDLVMVFMPLTTNPTVDTCSYWEKDASWAETSAIWCLTPAEGASYEVELGRVTGETGIQQINDNGFSYMSNGGNTQGCSCRYIAVKYEEGGGENKELVYELQAGGQWETFTNPDADELSFEVYDGNGDLFVSHRFTADSLENIYVYGSYTTLLPTFDSGKQLNVARTNDSATIYVSISNVTTYTVKVYAINH